MHEFKQASFETIVKILSELQDAPADAKSEKNFGNGECYIQQRIGMRDVVKKKFLAFAAQDLNDPFYAQDHHVQGIVGRYLPHWLHRR